MKHTFVIKEFTNPSGEVVFRVSGWLDGKRIRQNFPTYAEAKAEMDALEIRRVQGETVRLPRIDGHVNGPKEKETHEDAVAAASRGQSPL